MANHFYHLLRQWLPLQHQHQWVLGAITRTQGSVYRKAGALMLLSDAGHQLGLLSGGCLESDLLLQARKVMALGKSRQLVYDASEEDNLAWQLGIGCGGRAEIVLHPCTAENQFLYLPEVLAALATQQACRYQLRVDKAAAQVATSARDFALRQAGELHLQQGAQVLSTLINPQPHLLILGRGLDLIPLCDLALTLGWRVTLMDERFNPQRRDYFPPAADVHIRAAASMSAEEWQQIDALVVAHHNIELDAQAIKAAQQAPDTCRYIGLLGPAKRKAEVLARVNLLETELTRAINGPMGLALGGDLPENIALSVLAECHAAIYGSSALPLSQLPASAFRGAMEAEMTSAQNRHAAHALPAGGAD